MTKEEKDKLIASSDLNRKDNIKYISSEAQGIAITLDSDRYAPTFCKLERAYICGRRKSEAQIAELEKENAELKEKVNILDNCDRLGDMITEAYKDQLTKAKELLKEFVHHYKAKTIYVENMQDLLKQSEYFLSEVEK